MATITYSGEVENRSANEVYEASIKAFDAAEFEVWKKRPLAWLSLARRTAAGVEVSANLAARPTLPVSYTLTMSGEGLSEETLNALADCFLAALQEELSD